MRRLLKLEKITEATVEILDRFRHPGFSAFQGPAIQPDDTGAREKLAVYILRPPVALGRIDYQQPGGVIFHPSRSVAAAHDSIPKAARADGSLRLDPLESLAALTDHIPDKGQHLVRFYGGYSNREPGTEEKADGIAQSTGGKRPGYAIGRVGRRWRRGRLPPRVPQDLGAHD